MKSDCQTSAIKSGRAQKQALVNQLPRHDRIRKRVRKSRRMRKGVRNYYE